GVGLSPPSEGRPGLPGCGRPGRPRGGRPPGPRADLPLCGGARPGTGSDLPVCRFRRRFRWTGGAEVTVGCRRAYRGGVRGDGAGYRRPVAGGGHHSAAANPAHTPVRGQKADR
ncbi:hypothetical protein FNZ23_30405, partial [Streptomyces benahoarensis]